MNRSRQKRCRVQWNGTNAWIYPLRCPAIGLSSPPDVFHLSQIPIPSTSQHRLFVTST